MREKREALRETGVGSVTEYIRLESGKVVSGGGGCKWGWEQGDGREQG